MPEFERLHHQNVLTALRSLNGDFLSEAQCFFGGGTQLAMTYGEYRESRDMDFLCSSRKGFRLLREQVSQNSLGGLERQRLSLAREVRADRDGIRTFIDVNGARIKFEIVLEARIDLAGELDPDLKVPVLEIECAIAEKLLANADRGLDESTLSRDLVDLAFIVLRVEQATFFAGMTMAEGAYGTAVRRYLALALDAFRDNRVRADKSIDALGVTDRPVLRQGLRKLRQLLNRKVNR